MMNTLIRYSIFFIFSLFSLDARPSEPLIWGVTNIAPWGPNPATPDAPSISSDIIQELAQRTGQPMQVLPEPFARVLQGLRDNRLAIALTFRSPAAEDYSVYAACLFKVPIVAIARRDFTVRDLTDLRQLSQGIGTIRGVAYGDGFDHDPAIVKSIESDFPQMLRKLLAGRLDGVAGSTVMLLHHAKLEGVDTILGDRLALSTTETCIQVPKARADLPIIRQIAEAARAMMAEKRFDAIIGQYVGSTWQ
jgi:ABC-type amino acid transport substrate-binding protein